MNENLSLGRIAGIHVGLNWSLLVIGALLPFTGTIGIPTTTDGAASRLKRMSGCWMAGPPKGHADLKGVSWRSHRQPGLHRRFDNSLTTTPVVLHGRRRHAADDSPNTICGAPA